MKKKDIQPIETFYKGYRFRSRLEARWAVFFDACGADWEYEPEGFELPNGTRYLPDFLLHNVYLTFNIDEDDRECFENVFFEVKGNLTDADVSKIHQLIFARSPYSARGYFTRSHLTPTFIVSKIPEGEYYRQIFRSATALLSKEELKADTDLDTYCNVLPFNFSTILCCADVAAVPAVDRSGKFAIDDDPNGKNINWVKTTEAYAKARQAQFEHGRHGE